MLVLQGFIIGLGKIMPGVSGAMLALSFGLYHKMINSILYFKNNRKDNVIFLSKIIIGIIPAIIIFSKIIISFLDKYYFITILFFVGLIIGGIESIKRKTLKNQYNIIIPFTIFMCVLYSLDLTNYIIVCNNCSKWLYYLLMGIFEAITMVIPGISGTAVLISFGAYKDIMYAISTIFQLNLFANNIIIIIPFIIGLIVGLLIMLKIVNYFFVKKNNLTYNIILSFTFSSIYCMLFNCFNTAYTLCDLLVGVLLLFLGIIISKKINHYISND